MIHILIPRNARNSPLGLAMATKCSLPRAQLEPPVVCYIRHIPSLSADVSAAQGWQLTSSFLNRAAASLVNKRRRGQLEGLRTEA